MAKSGSHDVSELTRRAVEQLSRWYAREVESSPQSSDRYIVCAGLAVTERARESFPLAQADYITEKNQVRTSGSLIKNILKRHGEARTYSREGGRTTRATRTAADNLVERLNAVSGLGAAAPKQRATVLDALQVWLMEKVRAYFDQQRIELDLSLEKPAPRIVGEILAAAAARGKSGPVAQHLIGAKLSLRYPKMSVENHSYTTADQQLGRSGDFQINDTILHVTVAPMPPVIEKCLQNVRNGYRVLLLVGEGKLEAARQLAEDERIGVSAIEVFVGQNLEEIAEFRRPSLAAGLRKLFEKYNERVREAETDLSLQLEIPENLPEE